MKSWAWQKRSIKKAKQLDDEERRRWHEYEKSREEEYWLSKDWFNVNDIATRLRLGTGSGAQVNKLLERFGYQRKERKGWVVTDKAKGLCMQLGLEEGKRPRIEWKLQIEDRLRTEMQNAGDYLPEVPRF